MSKKEPSMTKRVYAELSIRPASTTQELNAVCGLGNLRIGKTIGYLVATGRAKGIAKRDCRVTGRLMTSWRAVS